jgi:hypothetical protein
VIELFPDVSQEIRDLAELYFDTAMKMEDEIAATNLLKEFRDLCGNKEFADFYFNLRFEILRNS